MALIKNNAVIGARIAYELAGLSSLQSLTLNKASSTPQARFVVIGGTCTDVIGKSINKFDNGSSNIGNIST